MEMLRSPAQFIEAVRRRGGEEWKTLGVTAAEIDTLLEHGFRIPAAFNIQHAWSAGDVVQGFWEVDTWVGSESFSFNPTTLLRSEPWQLPVDSVVRRRGNLCTNLGWMFRMDYIQSVRFDAGGTIQVHNQPIIFCAYDASPAGAPPTFRIVSRMSNAWLLGHVNDDMGAAGAKRYLLPDCGLHVEATGALEFVATDLHVITMMGWWEWCPALDRAETLR